MAEPLADAADLSARLGITFTTAQQTRANALLDDAAAAVRNYCRQQFTRVVDDTAILEGSPEEWLYLPERPVVSINTVTAGGALLASGFWRLQNDALFRYGGWDTRFYGAASPWNQPNTIVVVYTHGYLTIPDDIVGVVCKLARSSWINPESLKRYQLGSLQAEFFPESAGIGALDDDDKRILDFYRRARRSTTLSANLL